VSAMGAAPARRSHPYIVSMLTNVTGFSTDTTRYLEAVHVRADRLPEGQIVFTTTRPIKTTSPYSAIRLMARAIWSTGIRDIHSKTTAVSASQADVPKDV